MATHESAVGGAPLLPNQASGKTRSPLVNTAILVLMVIGWGAALFPWAWDYAVGGIYMWPLAGCNIVAWAVIVERWLSLQAAQQVDTNRLRNEVREALKRNDLDGAAAICERTSGPVAEILLAGLRKYKLLTGVGRPADYVQDEVVKAMEDRGVHVVADLERYLTVLAAVGNVAPLFGFLGTVSGMMHSFDVIAEYGMEAERLALYIAEALITTEAGLLIAIPAYIAFNNFTSRVQRFVLDIEQSASDFMQVISIEVAATPSQTPPLPPSPPRKA